MAKRSLTGIKPTGIPHIANYIGAIRPALALSEQYDAYYFIARGNQPNRRRGLRPDPRTVVLNRLPGR
jgi:hypothetical protein